MEKTIYFILAMLGYFCFFMLGFSRGYNQRRKDEIQNPNPQKKNLYKAKT